MKKEGRKVDPSEVRLPRGHVVHIRNLFKLTKPGVYEGSGIELTRKT